MATIKITVRPNGPYRVEAPEGAIELVDANGNKYDLTGKPEIVAFSGSFHGRLFATLAATDQQLGGAAPGIGFAIPSNIVTDIAGQIIKTGHVTNSHRAALGVRVQTVTGPDGQPAGAGIDLDFIGCTGPQSPNSKLTR